MKTSFIVFCLTILFILNNKSFSQSEAAVSFLTLPQSPSQNAMGYTGTSLPIDDPYGFLLNPAQLGNIGKNTNLSFMIYPSKVKIWGQDWFVLEGSAINLGYNLKEILGVPISVGMGYADQQLTIDYGDILYSEGEFQDKDKYKAYSIGVGFDYYVQFSTGITYKKITSTITLPFEPVTYEADGNTIDFGFLVNLPVLKLIDDNFYFGFFAKKSIKPFFNFSLGYSQLNIGDEIYYVDQNQKDPLPRTARLGYGISTGLDIIYDNPFRLIGIDFTVDAEDLLLKFRTDPGTFYPITRFDGYDSFTGDINIGRNIIQVKGDDNVLVHAGTQLSFFETFIYKNGHIKGRGANNWNTNGYELKLKGLLKLWALWANDPITDFISNHIDIRYYNSNYYIDKDFETNMKGVALYIQNLHLIF